MQIVTKTLLDIGVDEDSTINKSQLILLDIEYDEQKNWREIALKKELSDARAELFVLLNGVYSEDVQDKIIDNYKTLQKFRKEKPEVVQSIEKGDVVIYCDGGCTPNPGQAGSGISIYRSGKLFQLWYGLYEEMGTNNTAELGALYSSLKMAEKELGMGNKVKIKCDSMYSINCIKTWAISWEKKGWTKKGGEIKNLEIIKLSYYLYSKIKKDITLSHVKAHAGDEGNELADRMTIYAVKEKSKELRLYTKEIDIDMLLKMRD